MDNIRFSKMSCMKLLLLLPLVGTSLISLGNSLTIKSQSSKSIREKRFVIFPEGASFACSISQSVHLVVYPPKPKFTEGWNIHTVYDLPGNESLHNHLSRALIMRKKRSIFYENLEMLMTMNQIDGQACMYRTLCEAAQRLINKNTFFDALLNVLFHFPTDDITDSESKRHHRYISARISGLEGNNCQELYPNCPFSLLNMQPELF